MGNIQTPELPIITISSSHVDLYRRDKKKIDPISGISRRMPWTSRGSLTSINTRRKERDEEFKGMSLVPLVNCSTSTVLPFQSVLRKHNARASNYCGGERGEPYRLEPFFFLGPPQKKKSFQFFHLRCSYQNTNKNPLEYFTV